MIGEAMPKYFTLPECEKLLPAVDNALREAIAHKSECEKADQELESCLEKIRTAGGAQLDRNAFLEMRLRRDTNARGLKIALERVEQTGAVVKDLEIGLIDFLSVYCGREICLCWKLGEDRIGFWHGTEEGFRGRKPIDREFLENHGGDDRPETAH
jgi:hypothetical protein